MFRISQVLVFLGLVSFMLTACAPRVTVRRAMSEQTVGDDGLPHQVLTEETELPDGTVRTAQVVDGEPVVTAPAPAPEVTRPATALDDEDFVGTRGGWGVESPDGTRFVGKYEVPETPVHETWWFWTVIGVVTAGALATGLGVACADGNCGGGPTTHHRLP
ncbi:TPA: hypothetical protein DF272_05640 [Candidatus Falkowbacteria bacterium]|nr:hypothetical protein [Candidatus Falkowbacteria bacterium]